MSEPTEQQINSACMSYRHDFGLMDGYAREKIQREAREWLWAWQKEGMAIAAQQDGGWQPIETAPKDGSEIMIGSKNWSGEAFCAIVKWDQKAGEWMLFDPSDDAWSWPTYGPLYWMPLPTIPGSEKWTRNKRAIGLRQALDRS